MQGGYQHTPLFCVLCSTDHMLSWIVQALSWGTYNATEAKKTKLKGKWDKKDLVGNSPYSKQAETNSGLSEIKAKNKL